MNDNFKKLNKLIFIFAICYLLLITFSLPVFAQTAGEETTVKVKNVCFTKEECENPPYNGVPSAQPVPECKDEPLGANFYCYAKPPEMELQVSLGGHKVQGLGNYILRLYQFLISVVGIFAGIMITYAGVKWMMAVGNPEKINEAKKKISDALIGLVLVIFSYVILQTINPALVVLRLPPVKMIRHEELNLKISGVGNYCDPREGSETRKACEAKGYYCRQIGYSDGGPCLTAAKIVILGSLAFAGGAAIALEGGVSLTGLLGSLYQAGKATVIRLLIPADVVFKGAGAGQIAVNVFKIGSKFIATSVKTAAGIAAVKIEEATVGLGEKTLEKIGDTLDTLWSGGHVGICVPVEKTLEKGDVCDVDIQNCAPGLICVKSSHAELDKCWTGSRSGICSDRGKNAYCRDSSDCQIGLQCLTYYADLGIKACSDGTEGTACEKDEHCRQDLGLVCSKNRCMEREYTNVKDGGVCKNNTNCKTGLCYYLTEECYLSFIKPGEEKPNRKGVCGPSVGATVEKIKEYYSNNGMPIPDKCK